MAFNTIFSAFFLSNSCISHSHYFYQNPMWYSLCLYNPQSFQEYLILSCFFNTNGFLLFYSYFCIHSSYQWSCIYNGPFYIHLKFLSYLNLVLLGWVSFHLKFFNVGSIQSDQSQNARLRNVKGWSNLSNEFWHFLKDAVDFGCHTDS